MPRRYSVRKMRENSESNVRVESGNAYDSTQNEKGEGSRRVRVHEMDEVQLEHRLTTIENKIENGVDRLEAHIKSLEEVVKKQNGRVGTLEDWRIERDKAAEFQGGKNAVSATQVKVILAMAPFVFAGLEFLLRRF